MLPFYELTINEKDETGVQMNALVDVPAHMKNFITFSGKKPVQFGIDEEKRMVLGVMISANTPIYRPADESAPEHYVFFKPKTIEMIRKKFHHQQLGKAINEMHDSEKMIDGVTMIDSYIIGGANNPKAPEVFKDLNLQDGTWIASYFVENDDVWNQVKDGTFRGFSVEGIFVRTETTINKMRIAKGKFGTISEVSKWDIEVDQDSFEVGTELTTTWKHEDGTDQVSRVQDGEYMTPDGDRILVDSDGIIRNKFSIKMKNKKKSLFSFVFGSEEQEQNFAEVTAVDGTVLSYEGDLAAGTPVFVDSEGEQLPAPEGEYQITMDEKDWILKVDANGVVESMEEVTSDDDPTDEDMISRKDFKAFMVEYQSKVDEKLKAADETISAQAQKIKALEEFNKDKFNYSPRKPERGQNGSYKNLL